VSIVASALCGLLPYIGEEGFAVRRLYEGVGRSRVMYGAPAWANNLMTRHRSILLVRRLHRVTAIRIVKGYRIVTHASVTVLATSSPWELWALVLKQRYSRMRMLDPGENATKQAALDHLGTAEKDARDQWRS
jgi:hypothetical protein